MEQVSENQPPKGAQRCDETSYDLGSAKRPSGGDPKLIEYPPVCGTVPFEKVERKQPEAAGSSVEQNEAIELFQNRSSLVPRPSPYTVAFEKVERKQPEAAGEAVRNRMQQFNSFRTEARSMALEWMPTPSVRSTNSLTVHFYDSFVALHRCIPFACGPVESS
jgi:hypothetical protein